MNGQKSEAFEFVNWLMVCTGTGGVLYLVLGIVEESNIWPIVAILGCFMGWVVGLVTGIFFKLIGLPKRYLKYIVAFGVVMTLSFLYYQRHLESWERGQIIDATVLGCTTIPEELPKIIAEIRDQEAGTALAPDWERSLELHPPRGIFLRLKVARYRPFSGRGKSPVNFHANPWTQRTRTARYFLYGAECGGYPIGSRLFALVRGVGDGFVRVFKNTDKGTQPSLLNTSKIINAHDIPFQHPLLQSDETFDF